MPGIFLGKSVAGHPGIRRAVVTGSHDYHGTLNRTDFTCMDQAGQLLGSGLCLVTCEKRKCPTGHVRWA
ncbi:hypothetical protein ABIA39_007810 [Nocardia sp. GAS34]